MSRQKSFLYYIVNNQGRSLYVAPNGLVQTSPTPRWLESTPDGWQELSVGFGRSKENPGVFRSYTVPLKAVLDGSIILKYIAATEGIQAEYYLLIQKYNSSFDRYEDYFVGKIDITNFLGDQYGATINVLEGGLVELFKTKGNTPYEIPLDVPEAITLVNDGITLKGNIGAFIYNGTSVNLLGTHVGAFNLVQNDGGAIFGARSTDRVPIANFNGATVNATGQNFLQPNTSGNVEIKVTNLQLHVSWTGGTGVVPTPGTGLQAGFRVQEGDNILSTTVILNVSGVTSVYGPNITTGKTHIVTGTYNINVPENAKVYFICGLTVGGTTDALTRIDYLTVPEPQVEIDFDSRYRTTKMKVLRPLYVWDQLIRKISNGKYTGSSVPLNTTYKNTVLTSGDGIRGLEGAVIRTTLNDFIKSYYGQHALSPDITSTKATMEEFSNFYNDSDTIDLTVLGDVNNLTWEWAEEHIMSGIKVGSPDQRYDDLNGKDEINTTFEFETLITVQDNVKDLITPYRKDAYGIEFTRINLTNKKTTDSDSDNDTFMIDIADVTFVGALIINSTGNTITTSDRFQSVFIGSKITLSGTALNNSTFDVVSVVQSPAQTVITVQQPVISENVSNATVLSNEAALNRPLFDSITGVIAPDSIYNVMLSPKRALLAQGRYLHSGLDPYDNSYIKFLTQDKNDKLSTTIDGVTITEKEDVFVGSLPPALFRPIEFNFDTQVPVNLMELLTVSDSARYGKIKFSWKGNTYKMYILSASQVPQLNPSQQWKGLCAAGVNILPLING